MKLFLDSSSLAKRYIQEPGSEQLEEWLCKESVLLALSVIIVPEITSALNRLVREGSLSKRDYSRIKAQFLSDIGDAKIIQLSPAVISRSVKLLEGNVLRAMDSLHIACALEWRADVFLSSDRRQLAAAEKTGMKCHYVG